MKQVIFNIPATRIPRATFGLTREDEYLDCNDNRIDWSNTRPAGGRF